jgi:hypothetical protein
MSLHCMKSPNQPSLITKLKSHNLIAVRNCAKSSNCSNNPIFQQTDNSACGCNEMSITMAAGIANVCLSRRWKAEQVMFRSCIETPTSFTHLVP